MKNKIFILSIILFMFPVTAFSVEWLPMSSGTTNILSGVWGSSGTDVFAVGDSGVILHYNGSTWSSMASGTSNNLSGVWGSSNSNVFAVGDSGTILHYDGISWSIMTMTDPITDKLNSVWGWSPTGVFALGDNGAFLIYNGSWSSAMSGVFSSNLNAIWGPNGGNIFMIGDGGLIGHWDGGATGGLMDSRTTENLKNICGSSGTNVFVVGEGGTILHYGGSVSTTTTTTAKSTTTTTTPSTIINLSSFDATPKTSKVILQWHTESETDNAGFNLYRSTSEDGDFTKINAFLILSKGSATQGASYEFTDMNVQNRTTYWYKLEDIDLSGTSTLHGPVSATPRLIYGRR
jgi:hypothetical protein